MTPTPDELVTKLGELEADLLGAAKCEDAAARLQMAELRATIEAAGGQWIEPPPSENVNAKLLRAAAQALREQGERVKEMRQALEGIVANCQAVQGDPDSGAWGPMDPVNPSYLVSARRVEAARRALQPEPPTQS